MKRYLGSTVYYRLQKICDMNLVEAIKDDTLML